jgi:hypothetical protein
MVPSRPSSPFLSRRRFATRPDAPLHGSRRPSKRRVYRSDCGVETPARCPRRQRGASQPCNAGEMRNALDADEFPAEHTRPRNTTMVVAIMCATLMLDRYAALRLSPVRRIDTHRRTSLCWRRRLKLTAVASFPAARRRACVRDDDVSLTALCVAAVDSALSRGRGRQAAASGCRPVRRASKKLDNTSVMAYCIPRWLPRPCVE